MNNYSVSLPSYSIGAGCYAELPHLARFYGKTAVVLGGKTAMEKAKSALLAGIAGSDLSITDFIWYGGDSTYENGNALLENAAVQAADLIFGVGGGRACDTAKYVADKLDKPLFTFPTVASNCAAVTAISVMYHADGTFCDYYYPKPANHCLIDLDIIADSPERLLWAGIGDALSKECEAVFACKDDTPLHTPLMGKQMAHVCTDPLVEYGAAALADITTHTPSTALGQVTLDIIISTGIVSNMMTTKTDYYYNSTLAHCVYYGSTVTRKGHAHLHGEVVALGVLCLLCFDDQKAEFDRILRFNHAIGLPICFDDIEIDEDEFEQMADKFTATTEWAHRPAGISRESFIAAMKETNARGRAFKAAL